MPRKPKQPVVEVQTEVGPRLTVETLLHWASRGTAAQAGGVRDGGSGIPGPPSRSMFIDDTPFLMVEVDSVCMTCGVVYGAKWMEADDTNEPSHGLCDECLEQRCG